MGCAVVISAQRTAWLVCESSMGAHQRCVPTRNTANTNVAAYLLWPSCSQDVDALGMAGWDLPPLDELLAEDSMPEMPSSAAEMVAPPCAGLWADSCTASDHSDHTPDRNPSPPWGCMQDGVRHASNYGPGSSCPQQTWQSGDISAARRSNIGCSQQLNVQRQPFNACPALPLPDFGCSGSVSHGHSAVPEPATAATPVSPMPAIRHDNAAPALRGCAITTP